MRIMLMMVVTAILSGCTVQDVRRDNVDIKTYPSGCKDIIISSNYADPKGYYACPPKYSEISCHVTFDLAFELQHGGYFMCTAVSTGLPVKLNVGLTPMDLRGAKYPYE